MAQRCYVSVNTIKTHMTHIYRKLDVVNRSGAIQRAEEIGLLSATSPGPDGKSPRVGDAGRGHPVVA
jgi:hypothetical protein